jgi:hypothetical protein
VECRAGEGEDKGTQAVDWSSSVNKRSVVIEQGRVVCSIVLNVRTRVRDRTGRAVRERATRYCTLLQEKTLVGLVCDSRLGLQQGESQNTGDSRP